MNKPVALFDIDRTIYNGFSLIGLMYFQQKEGLVTDEAVSRLEALFAVFSRGEIKYEPAIEQIIQEHARGITGQTEEAMLNNSRRFYRQNEASFFPFARPLITDLQRDHDVRLVTGEFQFVGQAVGEIFDVGYLSSVAEVQDGRFTGEITLPLSHREHKVAIVKDLVLGNEAGSLAFGDSEGDVDMLGLVERAYCINPSDVLRAKATEKGWQILTPDQVLPTFLESSQHSKER